MAIIYTNGSYGLFDILGKIFHGMDVKNIARRTTISTAVSAAIASYKLKTDGDLDLDRAIDGLANAEKSDRQNSTLVSSYKSAATELLKGVIRIDSGDNRLSLTESLEYLIEQMDTDAYRVDDSVVSVSVAAAAGNSTSDLNVYASDIRGDGLEIETILAEAIVLEVTSVDSGAVTMSIKGEPAARSKIAEDWPAGSGVNQTITPYAAGDNILLNGTFEAATVDDVPDDWQVEVGVPGTTIELSTPTVQTVILSGTPTDGSYTLQYTDPVTSTDYSTETLSYAATSATIQTELRKLPRLSDVTVAETGTAPNLTHTITFTGAGLPVVVMTSVENFDTGSIAHAVTTTGDIGANDGVSLIFNAHASVKQSITQKVDMVPEQVYAAGYWLDPNSSASNTALSVLDGYGGAALDAVVEAPGADARIHVSGFLYVPENTTTTYVQLKKGVVDNTGDHMMDGLIIAPAVQLYGGGPYVGVFGGRALPEVGDKWTITAANNNAGDFQMWFDAVFDMAAKNLLLPVAGTNLIPDSLIA